MARTEFQIQVISHFASCSRTRGAAHCCLTLRSSGAPTAGRQARAAPWFILHRADLASYRRRPLNSNVRQQDMDLQFSTKTCACRRELNSKDAAKPRGLPRRALRSSGSSRSYGLPPLGSAPQGRAPLSEGKVAALLGRYVPGLHRCEVNRLASIESRETCELLERARRFVPISVMKTKTTFAVSGNAASDLRSRRRIGLHGISNSGHLTLRKLQSYTQFRTLLPNPSFKRSANGRPPGPRGTVVYPTPRGPGVLPSSPA